MDEKIVKESDGLVKDLVNDTISRQAAIEALEKIDCSDGVGISLLKCDMVDDAVTAIKALPSAQPEQRWIPCSERLPEKPDVYTVTDSNGRVVRFVFTGTDSSREYWKRCAKAWMPLPEPYREDES